jgi:hypothetical protein
MRTPSRPFRAPLTALSLLLTLGALLGCRDASPVTPDAPVREADASAGAAAIPAADKPDRQDYLQAFGADVFVIVGSTLRHPGITTDDSEPLFNVAGVSLDLTWGDWKRASATSTVHAAGPWTDVSIRLTGLVPGGVYSAFYVNLDPDSENPLCPGVERALPLLSVSPNQAPDRSSFIAGSDGSATFHARAAGNLLAPMQLILEIIYHHDGRTYGALPNRGEFLTQGATCRSSFGEDAMRQLLIGQKGP